MNTLRACALALVCTAPVLAAPGTTWRPPPNAPGYLDEVRVLPIGDGVLAVELSFGRIVPDGVFAPAVFWRPAGSSERFTAVGMVKRGNSRVALIRTQTGSMDYYVETYVLSSLAKDRLKPKRAGNAQKPLHFPDAAVNPADLPSGNVILPVVAPAKVPGAALPNWVNRGSGAFNDDKPTFYGVGVVSSSALQFVGLVRALDELAKLLDALNKPATNDLSHHANTSIDRKFGPIALTSLLKWAGTETNPDASEEIKLQLGSAERGLLSKDWQMSTSAPAREEQVLSLTTLDTGTDEVLSELHKAGVELKDVVEDADGTVYVLVSAPANALLDKP